MTEAGGEVAASVKSDSTLEISYFTDPLCCWSWGFEPQIRRLRYGFAGRIAWSLRMGGMIGDWNNFSDPLNDVHRPAQMGPLWIQAGTITGMPIEAGLWVGDPPASSWPACLAVRAAGLQSPKAADLYLRLARQAVMAEGRNIARAEVLQEIARELNQHRPDLFCADRFAEDYSGVPARTALEADVREARFRHVGRFPSLRLRRPGAAPCWLVGWRPWEALIGAVREFAPELGVERRVSDAEAYCTYWGEATEREIAVATANSRGMAPDPQQPMATMSSGAVL